MSQTQNQQRSICTICGICQYPVLHRSRFALTSNFLTLSELMYLPNLQSGRIRTRIIQVYKDGQLDFSEASGCISDYLTLKYLLKTIWFLAALAALYLPPVNITLLILTHNPPHLVTHWLYWIQLQKFDQTRPNLPDLPSQPTFLTHLNYLTTWHTYPPDLLTHLSYPTT